VRAILLGGPLAGKSTLARILRKKEGWPTFCGDPRSAVRSPEPDVTYMPEGLDWSARSQHVVDAWFRMQGPWVLEGHVMARALRKLPLDAVCPADRIFLMPRTFGQLDVMQAKLTLQVWTVWEEIAPRFAGMWEVLTNEHGED
jgi:hypothetical protein